MNSKRTLVAATPEILYGFLQNRLEREYHIYCQFTEENCPFYRSPTGALGIEFQPDPFNNVVEIEQHRSQFNNP